MLSVPKKAQGAKSPLLSYQHGTIFTDDKAPSNDSDSIEGIGVLAGSGYIVSSPDYLGYAESTSILHPYVHADSLASASIDMLRASKAFLASQNVEINNQLFLAGYSEGGYATIALQRELQKIGLKVRIDVIPPSTLRQARSSGKLPIFRLRQEWVLEENCYVLLAATVGNGVYTSTTLTSCNKDVEEEIWGEYNTTNQVKNKELNLRDKHNLFLFCHQKFESLAEC